MNPFEEYNYAMESWIVGSHHDSNHLLKQENWANTSLGHSDASNFPVFHDVLALQLVKRTQFSGTVYQAGTKVLPLRYSTRTCRLREQTNDDKRWSRECEKAKVLCKNENGTIFEIENLLFHQRNKACLNQSATFCKSILCMFTCTVNQ